MGKGMDKEVIGTWGHPLPAGGAQRVLGIRPADHSRGLTLIRTIVLACVLAPSDLGLMGIALLAMSTLQTFSLRALIGVKD